MMEETIKKLKPEELKACQMALELINKSAFELSMVKRAHQHLWNEIGQAHGLQPNDKIILDYQSGYVTVTGNEEDDGGLDAKLPG